MPPIVTNVDQKLLRDTKFPPEFSKKVSTSKINVPVIKNWAAGEISKLLGFEDDVVIGLLFDLLEGEEHPNVKVLQLQLAGFLGDDAASFCQQLWNLCLSAQESATGVPQQLLEAKKAELMQERQEQERVAEQARRRRRVPAVAIAGTIVADVIMIEDRLLDEASPDHLHPDDHGLIMTTTDDLLVIPSRQVNITQSNSVVRSYSIAATPGFETWGKAKAPLAISSITPLSSTTPSPVYISSQVS
ncbi:hypothetical protein CAC42_5607 [Sphaceloma murrayae]|uniref:PWI domain-containing protein n=1 Tax=Sphaceloma murrayae TaxID=2082308 RepID=A0A2K1QYQ3_9PEZI|nr:hypothetical protein CAC42_5607 [Sphaceloma murrayae]